jgi:hypothetical protein
MFAMEPGRTAIVAGRIAIIQSDQRLCLISRRKMHVIAQPVHWRLCDFHIPRMTGRTARGAASVIA